MKPPCAWLHCSRALRSISTSPCFTQHGRVARTTWTVKRVMHTPDVCTSAYRTNGRAPLLFQIKRWLPCSPGGMKWHLFTRSRIGPSVRQCPCLPCQLTTQHLLPAWPTHTTFGGQRADQGRHLIPQAPWAVWKNFGGQQHSVIITNDWGREEAWNI